jgi:hypothetical protein
MVSLTATMPPMVRQDRAGRALLDAEALLTASLDAVRKTKLAVARSHRVAGEWLRAAVCPGAATQNAFGAFEYICSRRRFSGSEARDRFDCV